MMYGRPSRVSVRPDYLTGYMKAVAPEPVSSARVTPVALDDMMMDDMMAVSISPESESMLSSNTARAIGVGLLLGSLYLFLK
jgi:hypothetical protein